MSKRKEKISAFLDNDLHHDELMSFSLSAESDDAKVALRYQMVGDALRDEMSESSFVDISHAVREALADENIADSMNSSVPLHEGKVADKTSLFDWSSWFKPVAGMAVAVSVAVILVSTISNQGANQGNGAITADNATLQPAVQVAVDEESVNKDVAGSNLNPYITQHLEFATQDTLQGRLPYVRAVSFEPINNESVSTEAVVTEVIKTEDASVEK